MSVESASLGKTDAKILAVLCGVFLLLSQLGVITWARWSIEKLISESVSTAIRIHDSDSDAHSNLVSLRRIEGKLDVVVERQLDVLQRLAAVQAIQQEQEARLGRIQGTGRK